MGQIQLWCWKQSISGESGVDSGPHIRREALAVPGPPERSLKKKTAVADQENRTHQDETNDDDERVAHPIATDRFSSLFFLDFRLMFHSPPQLPIRFPRISGFLLSLSLSHLVLANPLYPLALPSFFALVSRFRCAAPRNWNPHRVSSQLLNASRFVCFPGAHQNNPFLLF